MRTASEDFKELCLINSFQCVIDVHNYARWNGQVIGQGGPTNDGKLGPHRVPRPPQHTLTHNRDQNSLPSGPPWPQSMQRTPTSSSAS